MAKFIFTRSLRSPELTQGPQTPPVVNTPSPATTPAPKAQPAKNTFKFEAGSFNWEAAHNPAGASESLKGFALTPRNAVIPLQHRGALIDLKVFGQWAIGKLELPNGQRIAVKGAELTKLDLGGNYLLEGRMVEDPKYGEQMEVWRAELDVESVDSVVRHIVRNFEGVGNVIARQLALWHQEQGSFESLKEALIHAPSTVDFRLVTKRNVKLKEDADSVKRRLADSLSIRFGTKGLNQGVVTQMAEYLLRVTRSDEIRSKRAHGGDIVSFASNIFSQNPYEPLGEVQRYGFQTADAVGRSLGIDSQDHRRLVALVGYALTRCCEDCGHMWVTSETLFTEIARLDRNIDASSALSLAMESGQNIVIEVLDGATRLYPKSLRQAENKLTKHLARRLADVAQPLYELHGQALHDLISRAIKRLANRRGLKGFDLDASQRLALEGILTSRSSVHTLTAGPGCGKTAIVEVLMEALSERARPGNTTFCAPVGKAAKVLNERVGKWAQARTIHATLEFGADGFALDSQNPLDTDFIVIDECSMLGSPLAAALFDAIAQHSHILMLGDPGQLAPIEPGSVLKSLLAVDGFDHHQLTETHRNAGDILDLVKEVGAGVCRAVSSPSVRFTRELPDATHDACVQLAKQVHEASQRLGGIDQIGVICPMRKGSSAEPGWNVTYLNGVLRDEINPDPEGEKKIAGTKFRLNDRIILMKNTTLEIQQERDLSRASEPDPWESDPDESEGQCYVVNGDTGWVESAEYEYRDSVKQVKHLVLRLDDGRRVALPHMKLDVLALSYAITVHAAQGSEYKKVFAIVTDGLEQFMHRAMLFTMFSRAKEELTIYGSEQVLSKIAARPPAVRNCALAARVSAGLTTLIERQDALQSSSHSSRPRTKQSA